MEPARFARRGTVVILRNKQSDGEPLTSAERDQLAKLERYFECFLEVINALYRMGLVDRMALGSDAGPFDPEFGHMEYSVDLARQAGLSPMESLQVVTRNAARPCRSRQFSALRPQPEHRRGHANQHTDADRAVDGTPR